MHRVFRRIMSLAIIICMLMAFVPFTGSSVQADNETLTGKTAAEIVGMMGLGWNLGNTLDATGGNRNDVYSHETSWGNPRVTRELIHAVKEEGFDTIRIPTTWYNYADADFNIDQAYIDRVKEIVGWAYEEGLFIILNVHHENWVNDRNIDKNYVEIGYKLAKVWSQIADNFAQFDQHLIFEGMNEPRAAGASYEWSGNDDCYAAVNYLLQVFVNTVRASDKGYNKERALMIPGYAAGSSSAIMRSVTLPTVNGEVCNNLIVSVHCYSPYDFCLADTKKDFDPNSSSDTGGIDVMFNDIDSIFLSNGIPVIIGETSATAKNNVEAREKWAEYMGKKASEYAVPIVIWDNGSNSNSGGESHAHMDRYNNKANYPTVIRALEDSYAAAPYGSARGNSGSGSSAQGEGNVIWSEDGGKKSTKSWDAGFITIGSQSTYYLEGRDVVIEYSGSGDVKMILDSEKKSQWWIPVDPSEVKEEGGKKKAVFKSDAILTELSKFGITDPADLRNMCFITTTDDVTAYSVTVTGGASVITFMVNGSVYAMSSEMPADPTFTNMEFLGWYLEKDYRAGSEFKGGPVDSDITVYAKFRITDGAFPKDTAPEDPVEPDTKPIEPEETTAAPEKESKAEVSSETEKSQSDTPAKTQAQPGNDGGSFNLLNVVTILVLVAIFVMVTTTIVFMVKKPKGK